MVENSFGPAHLGIVGVGASGSVEVHILTPASGYQTFSEHKVTALKVSDPDNWRYFLASSPGNRAHDLYAVDLRDTASGRVEVHALSQASGYQAFIVHKATALAAVPIDDWQFSVASYDDGSPDLVGVGTRARQPRVEVHMLTSASGYQTFVQHAATALPLPGSQPWTYLIGGTGARPDLGAANREGTNTGHVEVHTLTAASGYRPSRCTA